MTAPNKMAKRAAAGTLALAVCLTGGVLGAGAAHADLPTFAAGNVRAINAPGTGNTTPTVVEGADGDIKSVQIDLGTTTFDTDDRIVVQLPTGFAFNNTIEEEQAEDDGDLFTATTGPEVTDISAQFDVAYLDGTTPEDRAITITPVASRDELEADDPGDPDLLEDEDTVTLTLGVRPASPASAGSPAFLEAGEELNVSVPANTNVDTVNVSVLSQTQAGAGDEYTTNGTFDVAVASTTEAEGFTASLPDDQMVTLDSGAQTVGPITIREVVADDDLQGTFTVQFFDDNGVPVRVDTAESSDALDPDVNAGTTGYEGTVAPAADGLSFEVDVTGTGSDTGSPESIQLVNLRLNPQGGLVGPIDVVVSSGGDDVTIENAIDIMTINDRLAGIDRFGTAAQVAREVANLGAANFRSVGDGVDNVVLVASGFASANGQSIDALTANYVAGRKAAPGVDVPILLTEAKSIPAVTTDAIRYVFGSAVTDGTNNYANKTVTIVGGTTAVGPEVVEALRDYMPGVRVERVEGDDRYATAARAVTQTATQAGAGPIVEYTAEVAQATQRTAVVASGEEAVDALSAGPYSYADNLPLLLTREDSLPVETESSLRQLGIKNVILLGGDAAISSSVESDIEDLDINVIRIDGADRYETSAEFQTFVSSPEASTAQPTFDGLAYQNENNEYFGNADEVFLANGVTFADALVSGPLAGSRANPLVISEADELPASSAEFITEGAADDVFPIGGVKVLEESVVEAAKDAADGGDGIDGLPEDGESPLGQPEVLNGLVVAGSDGSDPLVVTFAPFAPGSFDSVSSISYTLDPATDGNSTIEGTFAGGAAARVTAVDSETFDIPAPAADTYAVTVTIVAEGVTYTASVGNVVVDEV